MRRTLVTERPESRGAPPEIVETGAGMPDFERFFDTITPQLLRTAFLMTGSVQDAEDLVQEVLVRAWQHWDRISHHDHPEAWARRVLRNRAINGWRRRGVESKHRFSMGQRAEDPSAVEHLDIVDALARLRPRPRQAIILHDVIGLSVAEIGAEMRVPAGTVRSWLHRGRRSIAEYLEISESRVRKES
jgi:RNA polymerase sigma-70 factor (sigma-E family)